MTDIRFKVRCQCCGYNLTFFRLETARIIARDHSTQTGHQVIITSHGEEVFGGEVKE